jgi:hypothetical protein
VSEAKQTEGRAAQEVLRQFLILTDPVSGSKFCTKIYDEITKIYTKDD